MYIYICVCILDIYIYIHICLLYLLYFYIGFVSLLSKYSGYCEYETLFTLPISNVQYLLARPSQLGGPLYKTKKKKLAPWFPPVFVRIPVVLGFHVRSTSSQIEDFLAPCLTQKKHELGLPGFSMNFSKAEL